jgi:CRP-like cAMP-binding protein
MSDKVFERKTFQTGDKIFKEGDEGNLAFVLQSGEVQIVKNEGDDNEIIIATVGKGGIIGEMALIDNNNRMATARVSEGGAALIISRQMFEVKLNKADPFLRGLFKIFADHIRILSQDKAKLVKPKAPAKDEG